MRHTLHGQGASTSLQGMRLMCGMRHLRGDARYAWRALRAPPLPHAPARPLAASAARVTSADDGDVLGEDLDGKIDGDNDNDNANGKQ